MDSLRITLIILGALIILGIYFWTRRRARLASELPDDLLASPKGQQAKDDWEVIPVVRSTEPAADEALAGLAGMKGEAPPLHAAPAPEPAAVPAPDPEPLPQEPRWSERELAAVAEPPAAERAEPSWDEHAAETEVAHADAVHESATGPDGEMLVVLSVTAPGGEMFAGPAVVESAERAGLVYGDMHIYHWHEPARGRTVFSVANILEPGTFEPERMAGMRTPGLALFMTLPGPIPGGAAFDIMLETARLMAAELGGRVGDQARRPITERTIDQLRERADRIPARR